MKELQLGLIGAGHWGRAYIRTIAGLPGMRLARVASRNPETAALVGKRCVVCADWRGVASAPDLDGVIIASPPALHAQVASACLEARRPVLVEKPLTMSVAEAEALVALAKRLGGFVLVDHTYLFHPAYVELKKRAQALGAPRLIRSEGGKCGPFRGDAGPLWDFGSHDVAVALDLVGRGLAAVEAKSERRGQGEVIDIRLDFPGGARAELRVGNGFETRRRKFSVVFEDRELTFDDAGGRPLVQTLLDAQGRPAGAAEEIPVAKVLPLTRAVEAFAEAVRGGSKDLSSLELGAAVVRVLAACEASLGR
ncbi:MAG: Gfo/Idh/MocA family oxidoreductase [Elusimicrobia bacterium]|nr:Gfo/Idh/MocA family oxidoreductase [Elusimicrobiota bacterium]